MSKFTEYGLVSEQHGRESISGTLYIAAGFHPEHDVVTVYDGATGVGTIRDDGETGLVFRASNGDTCELWLSWYDDNPEAYEHALNAQQLSDVGVDNDGRIITFR